MRKLIENSNYKRSALSAVFAGLSCQLAPLREIVLFKDVKIDDTLFVEYCWSNRTKVFDTISDFRPGDRISFRATCHQPSNTEEVFELDGKMILAVQLLSISGIS